jgi:hypothetical protein
LVNYLGALNVDIIMDEGPDAVNMQSDTWDQVQAAMQGGTQFPPAVIIQLMNIPHSTKKQIMQMMQSPPDPLEQASKLKQVQRIDAEIAEKNAGTFQRITQGAFNAARAGLNAAQTEQVGFQQFQKDQSNDAFKPPPVQPSGPVQQAPQVTPQADNQHLPLAFAKGLAGAPTAAAPKPPVIPGARLAPDGRHYFPDPHRPGKYLMLA